MPASLRDLGDLGVRFAYPDLHVSGMLSGAEDAATITSIFAHAGFDEGSSTPVRVGASEETVRAELGEPSRDPFLEVWWYRAQGIALQMKDGAVERVTLFAPSE